MDEFGVSIERVKALAQGAAIHPNERSMLSTIGARADQYYGSATQLLPLIDADSRAALWVLVRIYHDLLLRIGRMDGDVFSHRVSVPTLSKIWILLRGMGMAAWNRAVA
jgi:phytoene synthase